MRAVELGEKRACSACAARFYDMRRKPAVCPICHAVQPPDKPRMARPAAAPRAAWGRGGPKPVRVEPEAIEVEQDAEAEDEDSDEDPDDDQEAEDRDDEATPTRVAE